MAWQWRESWALRAWLAAGVAAAAGVAVGWGNYFGLPGAMRIDWTLMAPIVVAFGGLCALLSGLGLGGGMWLASRRNGPKVGAVRLAIGASVGCMVMCTPVAAAGIGGFAHLNAPYAGTANILGSCLLASATFVALFAPALHRSHSVSLLRRFGYASIASCITAVTLGGLVWVFVNELDLVPSFPQLAQTAECMGLWTFSVVVGAGLTAALGAFVGLASWVYLSLMMAVRRND